MIVRSILVTALLVASTSLAWGQDKEDILATPVLRAKVTVEGDIVRVGDMVDNAGTAAQIAIYRSPVESFRIQSFFGPVETVSVGFRLNPYLSVFADKT